MKNGENDGVLAGVPFLSPSRAPRALAPKFPLPLPLPLLKPATQAMVSLTDRSVRATRGNSTKFFDPGYLVCLRPFPAAGSIKNETSKDYCKADLKQRVLFFITIFWLAIPTFFRFTDVTELM